LNFGSGLYVMGLYLISMLLDVLILMSEICLISSASIFIKAGPVFAKANYQSLRYIALQQKALTLSYCNLN
jgi:hypothetical protein